MPLVTAQQVQNLLGVDYDTVNTPDLNQHILTADALLQRVNIEAANRNVTLTSQEQFNVELWLSAHFYCLNDQTYRSKNNMGNSGSFSGNTGFHLTATKYGQAAMRIDWSGVLESIGNMQRAFAVMTAL